MITTTPTAEARFEHGDLRIDVTANEDGTVLVDLNFTPSESKDFVRVVGSPNEIGRLLVGLATKTHAVVNSLAAVLPTPDAEVVEALERIAEFETVVPIHHGPTA